MISSDATCGAYEYNMSETADFVAALQAAAEFSLAGLDWHALVYAQALAMYVVVRGFGWLAGGVSFACACSFVALLGWHGLAPIVAVLLAVEVRLHELELRFLQLLHQTQPPEPAAPPKRADPGPSDAGLPDAEKK